MKHLLADGSVFQTNMDRHLKRFWAIQKSELPFDVRFNLLTILLGQIGQWHMVITAADESDLKMVLQRTALCYLAIDILSYLLSLIKKEDPNLQDIREITELTVEKFKEYYTVVKDIAMSMPDFFEKQATLDFIGKFNASKLNSTIAIDNVIAAQELHVLLESPKEEWLELILP